MNEKSVAGFEKNKIGKLGFYGTETKRLKKKKIEK